MTEHVALFPGTFDPVTHGHLDLIRRGSEIFDALLVAVNEGGKKTHFPLEQRVEMLETLVVPYANVSVQPFDGLLVQLAQRVGATVLVRGVRGVQDYEYELEMAWANRALAPEVETVFLTPGHQVARVSSSLVREVAALGGDVSPWVPPIVVKALEKHPPAAPGTREED